jgi:hypothetical protein
VEDDGLEFTLGGENDVRPACAEEDEEKAGIVVVFDIGTGIGAGIALPFVMGLCDDEGDRTTVARS